ncbi:cytochrome-c peroxidase [Kaarinaea lacus]
MTKEHSTNYLRLIALISFLIIVTSQVQANELSDKEILGKTLFFDQSLSLNGNEACSNCHLPEAGWTGDKASINAHGAAYEGSIADRFGNRKPPSVAYATPSPVLHFRMEDSDALFIGGNFWNGRATGEKLGNPAADQALGPFLNPLEQGLADSACVVYKVCSLYPALFEKVWPDSCNIQWAHDTRQVCATENGKLQLNNQLRAKVDRAYNNIGLSIAAYEASAEVNQYTSKFDYYLAGLIKLDAEEQQGLELFKGKGKCADCHVLDNGPNGEPPLLTDFTFDNLGIPRNPENPWYNMPKDFNPDGEQWLDHGLGEFLATRDDYRQFAGDNKGKQKVPTVRNVDKRPNKDFVKAYMHNGYFKTLKGLVHFYNTRDTKPECKNPFTTEAEAIRQNCWPEPQIKTNLNTSELGDLGLTNGEENAIVRFMQILSDGYIPPPGVKQLKPGLR